MNEFITPLLGGILIGLSASSLLLFLGRIAGISGIVWNAIQTPLQSAWRGLFLFGLLAGVALFHWVTGAEIPDHDMGLPAAVIGGLLVGIGVKLGGGCTSGHGVCGLARLSLRSLVATLTFMLSGIIIVFMIRHVLGI